MATCDGCVGQSVREWLGPRWRLQPNVGRRLLAVAVAAAACISHAQVQGSYVLDTMHGANPTGGTQTSDGTTTADIFSNGQYKGLAGGNVGSCQGQMTFNYVWQGSSVMPTSVVVKVTTEASYGGSSGACDDGNGDGVKTNHQGDYTTGDSSGVRYAVVTFPASTLQVTITPTSSETSAPDMAQCAVIVSVAITNVLVTFDNVIQTNLTANECLPGMYEKATASAGGFTLSNFDKANLGWSLNVGGAVLKKAEIWNSGNPPFQSHNWQDLQAADYKVNPMSALLVTGALPNLLPLPVQYTFSAEARDPLNNNAFVGTVTGKGTLSVSGPDSILNLDDVPGTFSTSSLYPDYFTPSVMSSQQKTPQGPPGIVYGFWSRTPDEFANVAGFPGRAGLGQIVNLDWRANDATVLTTGGQTLLDTTFPFSDVWADPNMREAFSGDTPQVSIPQAPVDAGATTTYSTFLAYQPPSVVPGAVDWIPTDMKSWTWNCYAHAVGGGQPWYFSHGNAIDTGTPDAKYPYAQFVWGGYIAVGGGPGGDPVSLLPACDAIGPSGPDAQHLAGGPIKRQILSRRASQRRATKRRSN